MFTHTIYSKNRKSKSFQPQDGDSLVGCVQVRGAAQLRHRFQQGQHRVVENGKVIARDELLDDAFLFALQERFAQPDTERSTFAGRTVTVTNFQRSRTLALGCDLTAD